MGQGNRKGIKVTSPNFITDGVTIERPDGTRMHADFVDEIWPDRTCGQYDSGILVIQDDADEDERELFVSFTDASVWYEGRLYEGARCPEIAVMVAVRDVTEDFMYDEDGHPA